MSNQYTVATRRRFMLRRANVYGLGVETVALGDNAMHYTFIANVTSERFTVVGLSAAEAAVEGWVLHCNVDQALRDRRQDDVIRTKCC